VHKTSRVNPHPEFLAVGKSLKNLTVGEYSCKNAKFWQKSLAKVVIFAKIIISSTHNFLRLKSATVCQNSVGIEQLVSD